MISFWLIVFISVYYKQFSSCILSTSFFSFSKLVCNCFICNSLSGTLSISVFFILLNALTTSSNASVSWGRFFSFLFACSVSILCFFYAGIIPLYVFFFYIHFLVLIFQFLEFYYSCFIFTFPDFLCLVDLALLIDILHFFCILLHYFLFYSSFTFEIEPSLTISALHPCLDVFVTLHTGVTFYILLFPLNKIIFCFVFIIFWLFSSINFCTSITTLCSSAFSFLFPPLSVFLFVVGYLILP